MIVSSCVSDGFKLCGNETVYCIQIKTIEDIRLIKKLHWLHNFLKWA